MVRIETVERVASAVRRSCNACADGSLHTIVIDAPTREFYVTLADACVRVTPSATNVDSLALPMSRVHFVKPGDASSAYTLLSDQIRVYVFYRAVPTGVPPDQTIRVGY